MRHADACSMPRALNWHRAAWPWRTWPGWTAAGWAEIIARIRAAGWSVLLTAAPGDKEGHLIERIQEALAQRNEPPAASLAAALSL